MLTLCKSTVLGAAFLAGVAIAANAYPASTSAAGTGANPASRSPPQARCLAAFPPSTATRPTRSSPAEGCEGYGHHIFLDADAGTPSRRQYLDPVGAVAVGGFRRDGAREFFFEEGFRSENPQRRAEPASGREAGSPPRR